MSLFNEIYDLTYLPILTPANLIENLKLDNFTEINYSKNETGILAKILCFIDGNEMTFYYQFDSKNFLSTIYYLENSKIEYMFNRNEYIENLRGEFLKENIL